MNSETEHIRVSSQIKLSTLKKLSYFFGAFELKSPFFKMSLFKIGIVRNFKLVVARSGVKVQYKVRLVWLHWISTNFRKTI